MRSTGYAVFGKLYGDDEDKGWMRISRFLPSPEDLKEDVERLREIYGTDTRLTIRSAG